MPRPTPLVALLAIGALLAPAVQAQQYGQWSWDLNASAQRRSYDNLLDGEKTTPYDETTLALTLGVNGYFLHPAFVQFRAAVDTTLSRYQTSSSLGSKVVGADTEVRLLPQGRYATTLFFRRQGFSFEEDGVEDPLASIENPESLTTFGGRIRARRGPLRGLVVGYDRARLDYGGEGDRRTLNDEAVADYSYAGRSFRPHAVLRYRADDYGLLSYQVNDLTGTYDHRLNFGSGWAWQSSLVTQHRKLDYGGVNSSFANVRSGQAFQRASDLLEVRYDFGLTLMEDRDSQSHVLSTSRRWKLGSQTIVMPSLGYGLQLEGEQRVQAPRASVSASWTRQRGSFDLAITPAAGVQYLLLTGPVQSGSDTTFLLDGSISVGHGVDMGLRKQLSVTWSHNRLSQRGESRPDLPDLGTGLGGLGTEDDLRARLDLRRSSRTRTVSSYVEWRRLSPSGALALTRAGLQSLTASAQGRLSRVGLAANLGRTETTSGDQQEVVFGSLALTVRPMRLLALQGSWRRDQRTLALAPRLDSDRVEGNADLQVGAFLLRAQVFRTLDHSVQGGERINQGFNLSLTRRFSGWLPLVTGAYARGAIR